MGGDCDTVGAIAGQIAGAIYGYNEEMDHLYKGMQDFTKERFEVFLLGVKLGKSRWLIRWIGIIVQFKLLNRWIFIIWNIFDLDKVYIQMFSNLR